MILKMTFDNSVVLVPEGPYRRAKSSWRGRPTILPKLLGQN